MTIQTNFMPPPIVHLSAADSAQAECGEAAAVDPPAAIDQRANQTDNFAAANCALPTNTSRIMHQLFCENRIPHTSFNRRLFALGAAMRGRGVAFDLDKTLLDSTACREEGDYVIQAVQLKPGAEAFLLGFSQHNEVLLLTSAHARRLLAIFSAFPILWRIFGAGNGSREFSQDAIIRSRRIFCYENLIQALGRIADRARSGARLEDIEVRIRDEVLANVGDIKAAAHIKSLHLAMLEGKVPFDVLVDDDQNVERLKASLAEEFFLIRIPSNPDAEGEEGLNAFNYNTMLLIAGALLTWHPKAFKIVMPRPLHDEEPRRAIIWFPPEYAFRPEAGLRDVARRLSDTQI